VRTEAPRIALVGYGHIGRALHAAIEAADGLRFAGAVVRTATPQQGLDASLRLDGLAALRAVAPDVVVEAAHPDVTRAWGEAILGWADYLPLSLTALADAGCCDRLAATAGRHGRRLLIPHGALVGADSLYESRETWESVEIEFRKHPSNLRFPTGAVRAFDSATVVFEGTVREIAPRYPLNVNAMVACALMTVGLDRCRARLVADPATSLAHLRIVARGYDGSTLELRRDQPVVGVSGTEMVRSTLQSLRRAAGARGPVEYV
jgi:aspartate dehydrogenase